MKLKGILPSGLLGRSLLIIVIPLILLQVVTGFIFYDRHWATVSRHRANAVAGDIGFLIGIRKTEEFAIAPAQLQSLAAGRMDIFFEVTSDGSRVDGSYVPRGNLQRTLSTSLTERVGPIHAIEHDSVADRVTVWVKEGDEILRFETSSKRLISSTTRIFIAWMVSTSIILFAVATLFMRNQVRPMRRLARAAENFGKGRIETDFKPSGALEVRRAADAFLAMRERIRRQIQQRTVMLAGVSHDLRTPLTRMKLQIAMIPNKDDAKEMQNDVAEMENMITGYLDFVRGEGTEETQDAEIAPLLNEVARSARINEKDVKVNGTPDVTIPVRRDAFKRCLTNLVTNGVRHGADHVEVSAYRTNGHLVIAIDDDGPGIPEDQRDEVFRPFYRLDQSRNLDTGGTGLGLPIALDIVHGHGGELTLHDSPMGGLRALIRLPL